MTKRAMGRSARRIGLVIAIAVAMSPANRVSSGPLDPEDRAKVAEIDDAVEDATDTASDLRDGTEELILLAEKEAQRLNSLRAYNAARLRLNLERMMLSSCAVPCLRRPLPPLPPAPPRSAICWSCINPRLPVTRANGGLLEDAIELVDQDLAAIQRAGLPGDVALAELLLGLAQEALLAGDTDEAFTDVCQAYGALACDPTGRLRLQAGERRRER